MSLKKMKGGKKPGKTHYFLKGEIAMMLSRMEKVPGDAEMNRKGRMVPKRQTSCKNRCMTRKQHDAFVKRK